MLGKPSGAGGGGCVFFIAKSTRARRRLTEKLRSQGLRCVDVVFDFDGLGLSSE